MSEQTHEPEKPAASTERARRCRLRRKAGDRWVPGFDVSREVLERLFEEGWTTEEEASDPQKLSDVVADFLDCWAKEEIGSLGGARDERHDHGKGKVRAAS